MNIIIPLGGKGERFSKKGFLQPKPLIEIFDKTMIEYVIDNLTLNEEDKLFIIYDSTLNSYDFSKYILNKYPFINFVEVKETSGASETLYLGIDYIFKNYTYHNKCLILDCDTFYTEDITNIFRDSEYNTVFYTKNFETNPIYSYIELNNEATITKIREKEKISNNANTGAYAFTNINELYKYCKIIIDNNIKFNNEPYTSCVISEMIKSNIFFKGFELKEQCVFSLGTPDAVERYIKRTSLFLFDLDGTLVITDDIYFDVWEKILKEYNIYLSEEIFKKFIQGNNDKYVLNTLLKNMNVSLNDLSLLKDSLFIKNISKLKLVPGVHNIIQKIKELGHKICIVTNCNRVVAEEIVKLINIDKQLDFIISSNDCINGKPCGEPYENAVKKYKSIPEKCIIFEDSKSGILSGKCIKPKILVGIETNYNNEILLSYGAQMSIKNYLQLDIHTLNQKESIIDDIAALLKKNTSIIDAKEILVDEIKLKGGFIADVNSFKIITTTGKIYSQIMKYENREPNDLSNMARKLKLYEREYYFYTTILNNITCINVPKYFNLIKDDENMVRGIVLENLLEKNYKINLNLNHESIDVTLKIVDRMAKLHSTFWDKNITTIFPELKCSNDAIFCPFFNDFITERYELFKTKWFKILSPFQIEKCNEIFLNFSKIQNNFSSGKNLTFIHGDIKSPNIFYDIENNFEPHFIDWQHCAVGKGVQDLIFFIIESFDITNLQSMFYITKEYYYKKLQEYGIKNYSIDEYEKDIYDAVCYIPYFTSMWFGTIPHDELIDKNFPYFLISKMFYLIDIIQK